DLVAVYFLWKLLQSTESKRPYLALAFYFLNPIVLFGVYVFGRYETFPIAFLLASLLAAKNQRHALSSLLFGLMILTRTSLLMLLPMHILLSGNTLRHKVQSLLIAILPFG